MNLIPWSVNFDTFSLWLSEVVRKDTQIQITVIPESYSKILIPSSFFSGGIGDIWLVLNSLTGRGYISVILRNGLKT